MVTPMQFFYAMFMLVNLFTMNNSTGNTFTNEFATGMFVITGGFFIFESIKALTNQKEDSDD